jgi:uncharacterized membrane protein
VYFSFTTSSEIPNKVQDFWSCTNPVGISSVFGTRILTLVIMNAVFGLVACTLLAQHHEGKDSVKVHRNQSILVFPCLATLLLQMVPVHPRLLFNLSIIVPQLAALNVLLLWIMANKTKGSKGESVLSSLSEASSNIKMPTEFLSTPDSKVCVSVFLASTHSFGCRNSR